MAKRDRAPGPGTYTFVRGATLLAAASLASRLLGGLARIPLTRLLGGEGMGLFQMAYVIYGLAITFAVSGLSVATSRVVAEWVARGCPREAGRVLGAALLLGAVSGAVLWFALHQGAPYLATRVLGDSRVAPALQAVASAILPVSLVAAFRGYFQGFQDMAPTSSSQVLEQFVRVGVMVWAVWVLRGSGVERAVGGASYGNTVGAAAALAVLVALHARRRAAGWKEGRAGGGQAWRESRAYARVLAIAVPVTLGAAILPLMDAAHAFLVPNRLQVAGLDPREATYLYGQLHGMAYPLAGLPAIVASALAAALVPAITDALERGQAAQVRSRTDAALRLTVLFSLPATAGLLVLAQPINAMLFGIPEAGVPLTFVSGACLLIALQQTTAGVLQGLGRVTVPVYGLLAGMAANIVATYFLTAVPSLGVNGAALGIVAGFFVAAIINLVVTARATKAVRDVIGLVSRPAVAAAVMAVAARTVYGWAMVAGGGNTVATILAVLVGVGTYAVALLVIGGLRGPELEHLPGVGPRLAALLSGTHRRRR